MSHLYKVNFKGMLGTQYILHSNNKIKQKSKISNEYFYSGHFSGKETEINISNNSFYQCESVTRKLNATTLIGIITTM